MGIDAPAGPYGATAAMEALGVKAPTPADLAWMQQFRQGAQTGLSADDLYSQYLKSVQLPQKVLPLEQSGLLTRAARRAFPLMDTAQGHAMLKQSLGSYPFTEQAKPVVNRTLIRSSNAPDVIEEEAETNPERLLGIPTGRDKMKIAESGMVSPLVSVTTHELMHSYLDQKGYPYGEDAFNQDWEKAKQTTPLLANIDQFLAKSPDYTDEQNRTDLSQERFAYLAQALSGRGLTAFPQQLQRHYQGIFR